MKPVPAALRDKCGAMTLGRSARTSSWCMCPKCEEKQISQSKPIEFICAVEPVVRPGYSRQSHKTLFWVSVLV